MLPLTCRIGGSWATIQTGNPWQNTTLAWGPEGPGGEYGAGGSQESRGLPWEPVSGCSYLVTVTGGVTFLLVTRFWSVLNHMVHFVVFESF